MEAIEDLLLGLIGRVVRVVPSFRGFFGGWRTHCLSHLLSGVSFWWARMMRRVIVNSISIWSNMTCLQWVKVSLEPSILGEIIDLGIFSGVLPEVVSSSRRSLSSHGGVVGGVVKIGSAFEAESRSCTSDDHVGVSPISVGNSKGLS